MRQALSHMIHDSSNPLAVVMFHLCCQTRGGVAPEHLRYLDMATSEAQKMSSFDDMLMLANHGAQLSISRSSFYVKFTLLEQVRQKVPLMPRRRASVCNSKNRGATYPVVADVAPLPTRAEICRQRACLAGAVGGHQGRNTRARNWPKRRPAMPPPSASA